MFFHFFLFFGNLVHGQVTTAEPNSDVTDEYYGSYDVDLGVNADSFGMFSNFKLFSYLINL